MDDQLIYGTMYVQPQDNIYSPQKLQSIIQNVFPLAFEYPNHGSISLSILKNDIYNVQDRKSDVSGVKYLYRVEVESPNEESFISGVSKLLFYLWSKNYKATVSSDLEDRLPYKGGFFAGVSTQPNPKESLREFMKYYSGI